MRKLLFFYFLIPAALVYGQGQASSAKPTENLTQAPEKLAADTPKTTVQGNASIAPKDWSVNVKGTATILEPPEGGSFIALVDVQANTADEALKKGWDAY